MRRPVVLFFKSVDRWGVTRKARVTVPLKVGCGRPYAQVSELDLEVEFAPGDVLAMAEGNALNLGWCYRGGAEIQVGARFAPLPAL